MAPTYKPPIRKNATRNSTTRKTLICSSSSHKAPAAKTPSSTHHRARLCRHTSEYIGRIAEGDASYQQLSLSLAQQGLLLKKTSRTSELKQAPERCLYISEFLKKKYGLDIGTKVIAYDLVVAENHPDLEPIFVEHGCMKRSAHLQLLHQATSRQVEPPASHRAVVSFCFSPIGHLETAILNMPPQLALSVQPAMFHLIGQRTIQFTSRWQVDETSSRYSIVQDTKPPTWKILKLSNQTLESADHVYSFTIPEKILEACCLGKKVVHRLAVKQPSSIAQRLLAAQFETNRPTHFEVEYSLVGVRPGTASPSGCSNKFRVLL
ncbi:hypothetical protein NMY22_g2932 [Coprinellus aureogranulatus]|nr:hypothetical protein NMY22_g2932 [Coprinellus aureogranulatus]